MDKVYILKSTLLSDYYDWSTDYIEGVFDSYEAAVRSLEKRGCYVVKNIWGDTWYDPEFKCSMNTDCTKCPKYLEYDGDEDFCDEYDERLEYEYHRSSYTIAEYCVES